SRSSRAVGRRASLYHPGTLIRPFASRRVMSAWMSRHAGFGAIAAYDECWSTFAVRLVISTYRMPLHPSSIFGVPSWRWSPPALVDDHLAEDDVRSAIRRIFARLETVLGQETPDEGSGLRLGPLVRRDRGKSNVLLENLQGLPRVRFNTGQDIREGQSTHPRWEGRRTIRTRRV